MPQPLRGRMSDGVVQGTLILRNRPKIAMMVGLIASEWANLDDNLAHMFAIATADVVKNDKSTSLVTHPVAVSCMRCLESLNARLSVIAESFSIVMPQTFQDAFEVLATSIRKCAKGRNIAVHGVWGITDRYPQDGILIVNGSEYTRYTEIDFNEILNRILRQIDDITVFLHKCEDHLLSPAPPAGTP